MMRAVAALALLGSASVEAVMNAGGVPYQISNPNENNGQYSTEFADESPEYFDSYAEVKTQYSQVYWTRSPNIPLPPDIVKRFEGKVMAITGYEVDQVEKKPDGDKSVPIYNAYNHHYFGWLMGDHSEMFKLDKPKDGQTPTYWDIRDTADKPKNNTFPTNIVFKENPGGEYRKSYHGYPHGYAQLLHSPKHFVCEPMQIDTHNRDYEATDARGYEVAKTNDGKQFLPQNVINGGENLASGLSPLIECPCSTRITRSTKNSSAILTADTCGKTPIKTEHDCTKAISLVAPVTSSVSISNSSMAYGCTMRPSGDGTYTAVFNSANTTSACGAHIAKGPFTWASKGNVSIGCGLKHGTACIKPDVKYGCDGGSKTQCIWKSVVEAEKGCNAWEECEAYFCSTKFSAAPALKPVAEGKGPLMCFGRGAQVTAASAGDTAYVKAYTNPQSWEFLTGAATESLHGPSLVNLTVTHDGKTATITMTGPAGNWYGVGFNAQNMADTPYAIIVHGDGKVTERKLGPHRPGTVLAASVKITSSSTIDGIRKVVLTRPVAAKTKDYFAIPTTPGQINLITAIGNTPEIAYHKARTGAIITLLPEKVDACLCAPTTTEYLTYMNASTAAFHYDCIEEPRGDMAHGQRLHNGQLLANGTHTNPACAYNTYHGGLRCCQHKWFLTDLEQNASIPDKVDTYYLKWRFYFQEYKPAKPAVEPFPAVPASHQHLHHWVFLIDANVNDYEEVRCEDGTYCEGSITAHLQAKDMGLEDVPGAKAAVGEPEAPIKNESMYTGMKFLVMTPHCHAPSCLRQEMWNNDTGELICRSIAKYGTGIEVFNEVNYVAIPPCIWGEQNGLHLPVHTHPDTNLTAIKYFNNTFRHMGQMAQWTGLMTYEGVPGGNPY